VSSGVDAMPYPALNSAFDALLPAGLQHYWKADFVRELTDDAIAAHVECGPRVPCVESTMHLYPIDGACHRVASDATAFAFRDARFACVIAGNFMGTDDSGRVRDNYGANFDRLVEVKRRYDPENVFRTNQNVDPAA
jgi:hypothetical protein